MIAVLAGPITGADYDATKIEQKRQTTELSLKLTPLGGSALLHAKCDEPNGPSTITDSSSYGNVGTTQNVTYAPFVYSTSVPNKNFRAVMLVYAYGSWGVPGNYISFGSNFAAYDDLSNFTVGIWSFSLPAQSAVGAWNTGAARWRIYSSAGKLVFQTNTGSATSTLTSVASLTSKAHIVVTYAAGVGKIYINGVASATTGSCAPSINSARTSIQINAADSSVNANGQLVWSVCDFRMFNRALTDVEVAAWYNGGAGTLSNFVADYTTSCILNAAMQATSGSTLADTSGIGNNGSSSKNLNRLSLRPCGGGSLFYFYGNSSNDRSNGPGWSFPYISAYNTVTDTLSISVWAHLIAITTYYNIVSRANAWSVTWNTSWQVILRAYDAAGVSRVFTSPALSATMHHIVFSYTASTDTCVLYVDGIVTACTKSGTAIAAIRSNIATPILIRDASSDNSWMGLLDDVRVFNSALSSDEVAQLWDNGTGDPTTGDFFPTTAVATANAVDGCLPGTTWYMPTFVNVENPNSESGTVLYAYAVDDTDPGTYAAHPEAYSQWYTLAQFKALTGITGRYLRVAFNLTGNGSQDATIGSFGMAVNILAYPPVYATDLRSGVDRGDGVTGTCSVPSPDDVRLGVAIDATTGTCSVPSPDDVRLGVAIDHTTGAAAIPSSDNVLNDIEVDHTVGNFVYPPEENVEKKFKYGANGTQFTGSLKGVGILLLRKIGEDFMSDIAVEKHYVGEIGTKIVVNTGKDLTEATVTKIKIERPDGTILDKTGAITTIGGLPHFIAYTTIAGDFNVPGQYKIQPYVELPTFSGYGATACFKVYEVWK